MADFAREYQLDYLLLTPDDYYRDLDPKGTHGLTVALQSRAFQQLYRSQGAAIYRLNIRPPRWSTPASVSPHNGPISVQSQQVRSRLLFLTGVLSPFRCLLRRSPSPSTP